MRVEPLFICALLSAPLAGQSIKTLDLTTASTNRQFYVIFAARGGSATGHAFVLWGTEDGVPHYSTVKAYGLYPENEKDACSAAIRRVLGALVEESARIRALEQRLCRIHARRRDFALSQHAASNPRPVDSAGVHARSHGSRQLRDFASALCRLRRDAHE